ncbi:MAG: sugar phosphate isomerase/epimerase family protein [Chthonomonadales bacterium]
MKIQFGVNTWTWVSPFTTAHAPLLFPKIRQMGFDAVEIALEDPELVDGGVVRSLLQDHSLGVTVCGAFGPGRDLSSEDASIAQAGLDYIARSLDFCAEVGARVFAGPAYSAVGKARHLPADERLRERDRSVERLKRAGAMAWERGVVMALEPLNRFETDMVNTCEQICSLLDAVGSEALAIHLDTFHMTIEENSILDAVLRAGSRLRHVHASESNRGTPGRGLVRWNDLRDGLRAVEYSGAVVIETFTPEVKEIARAAAIWRPLAPSQDALAADGLAFLKSLFAS